MSIMKVFLVTMALVALPVFALGATINEIRIDQPGDNLDEYFELAGTPGESLDGLTYIVIGDDPNNSSGWVECVVNLDGFSIAADGVFLYVEADYTGSCGDTPDEMSTTHPLIFEDEDHVTHMLVSGFTGALNTDLDTDDDGVLDSMPWTAILDDMAFIDNVLPGNHYYSNNTVAQTRPSHVGICDGAWVSLARELCDATLTESPGYPQNELCGPVADTNTSFGAFKAMYR